MPIYQVWLDLLSDSFNQIWDKFLTFLPDLIGALIVFIIGWIIAIGLGNLVARLLDLLHVDELFDRLNVKDSFKKAGLKLNVAGLIGWLVKWFLIIVFLITAADILEWTQITEFLNQVVAYIPSVIISVIILLIGFIAANFVEEVVEKGVKAAKLKSAGFLAGLSKWAIVIFAFMSALVQLGIATPLIQTLFTGFVAMLAIAGGLAFGLGGKEQASKFLDRLRKDISAR